MGIADQKSCKFDSDIRHPKSEIRILQEGAENTEITSVPDPNYYARLGRLSAVITVLPASMAAGWIAGYYLVDYFLGTFPWGSLAVTLIGAGAGFYEIVRLLSKDKEGGS